MVISKKHNTPEGKIKIQRITLKQVHKTTWISPDQRTENQIDHICINRKFRSALQDVKVHRGADVATDHHLLIAKLRLKLKRHSMKRSQRTKYNVNHLKDQERKNNFSITLTNKYSALQLLDEESVEITGCRLRKQ